MKAWIFQDAKQVAKVGADKASYYVGWFDPDGKRRCKSQGSGSEGKKHASRFRKKVEAELLTGTYQAAAKKMWADFRRELETRILPGMSASNRRGTLDALRQFEKHVKPGRVATINTQMIDDFKARRSRDPGKKKGETARPATVNKELRQLRAVLNIAKEWKYLPEVPRFRMLREPSKLPTYVTPEHFAAIYRACKHARKPTDIPGIDPADWWQALMVFAYMTGWRIGQILLLRRADVDLDAGTAVTRAEDNKGKRDDRISLHPTIIDHLRRLPTFDVGVFPWNHDRRTLDVEFDRIQRAAGITLPCSRVHEHTEACHVYGFHDLRRAFATMNADRLSADALQKLMQHRSYQTTQRYINMTSQLREAVANLHVPDVLLATG